MQMTVEELRKKSFEELYEIIVKEEFHMLEDIEDTIEVYDKFPFLFFFKIKKRYPRFEFRSRIFALNVAEDPVIKRNIECLDNKAYIIQEEIKKLIKLKKETDVPEDILKEKIIDFLMKYNYFYEKDE